jgi:hypothetical protein
VHVRVSADTIFLFFFADDLSLDIRGLDLSMNLLPSWDVVAMIVRELPALQRLALKSVLCSYTLTASIDVLSSRNRFQPVADRSTMIAAFTGLTELQLNGTLMTWSDMQAAIADMPNLRIVEMGYNRLASLSTPATHLPDNRALQVINLDSNVCSDWVHVYNSLRQYVSYVFSLDMESFAHPCIKAGACCFAI